MGYYNPFYQFGEKELVKAAKEAGANGFIIVDLPPEESEVFRGHCTDEGMSLIPLIAPTTSDTRLKYINKVADSFVYCISLLGVTGNNAGISADLADFIGRVRSHVAWPLAIGFGVTNREQLNQVAEVGDGVVVGSKVKIIIPLSLSLSLTFSHSLSHMTYTYSSSLCRPSVPPQRERQLTL